MDSSIRKGKFISIEGTDGSGKSTQLRLLKELLDRNGISATYLREPGSTLIGEKIRNVILDPDNDEMTARTEMFLYAATRAQLVEEKIRPLLERGELVICDRFVDSSYAYQSFGRKLPLEMVVGVNEYATGGTMPDATLVFDINPVEALRRRHNATSADRLEQEPQQFFNEIYAGYQQLEKMYNDRIRVIDATRSIEEVALEVKKIFENILGVNLD